MAYICVSWRGELASFDSVACSLSCPCLLPVLPAVVKPQSLKKKDFPDVKESSCLFKHTQHCIIYMLVELSNECLPKRNHVPHSSIKPQTPLTQLKHKTCVPNTQNTTQTIVFCFVLHDARNTPRFFGQKMLKSYYLFASIFWAKIHTYIFVCI
jgi:hypothetical protein